jgi:HAD superfamily hydrolase (TIGR01490 family)
MEAAFFDLDKTVIAKASLVAFGRPLYDAGMISRVVILRALWSNLLFHYLGADENRIRKFRSSALRMTRGWDQALVSAIVRDALVEVIEPIVYAEALDLIQEHQREGRRVFLVSASPEEIVAPLAQFLGVDEAIASRAELDADGRYTGEVEFWSYGPYKAEAILQVAERYGIDLDRSYAYSDSGTDLPMLEVVGHPVAVNPDRDLARVARDRGWDIRWFEHGVPLRERVNMPRPGKVFTIAATVIVLGTAGTVVWWWIDRRLPPVPTPMVPPARSRWARRGATRPTVLAPATPGWPRQSAVRPAAVLPWLLLIPARRAARRPEPVAAPVRLRDRALPWATRPAASSPRKRPERAVRRSR